MRLSRRIRAKGKKISPTFQGAWLAVYDALCLPDCGVWIAVSLQGTLQ